MRGEAAVVERELPRDIEWHGFVLLGRRDIQRVVITDNDLDAYRIVSEDLKPEFSDRELRTGLWRFDVTDEVKEAFLDVTDGELVERVAVHIPTDQSQEDAGPDD